jgi:methylmalonyl-CoA mutase
MKILEKGSDAVNLKGKPVKNISELKEILSDIDLTKNAFHFGSAISYPTLLVQLKKTVEEMQVDGNQIEGSFDFDPISFYLLKGEFYETFDKNMDELAKLLKNTDEIFPKFKVISVNAQHIHNSGANAVQELAYGLSIGVEYFNALTERGFEAKDLFSKTQAHYALGSSFFIEIAKIRAARVLWAKIAQAYGTDKENAKVYIHGITSEWNKSIYDPYVNMLRTTTEAMSAAIAACDSVTVNSFDETFKYPDKFSNRIARNQQILLKEESHLNKVIDPSAGSYFIENLTNSLVEEAWKLFLAIEDKGGFIKFAESGELSKELEATKEQRDNEIAKRKISIVGVNQFPNSDEEILDKLENLKESKKAIIHKYRAAESFEKLRLATEKFVKEGNKKPIVFLLTYGNLAMRKARANFAKNFFGVAGYEVIEKIGFDSIDKAYKAAKAAKADIIVLCSSDDEYMNITKELKKQGATEKLVVAGYPKEEIEALKEKGVFEFIHVKSNLLESLRKFQESFNIKNA